jgi:hypothetical protein
MPRPRTAWIAFALAVGAVAVAQDLESLVAMLATDASPKVRSQAALELAAFPGDAAVDPLIAALRQDSNPMVRGASARALGMQGSARAYASLVRASRDPDAFVSKWAGWGVRQVLAVAPSVQVGLTGLVIRGGVKPAEATIQLQATMLDVLMATGRFDVATTIDFGDDAQAAGGAAVEPVAVELQGDIAQVTGDAMNATVTLAIRAVTPAGMVAWSGRASGTAKGEPAPPPDPDDDEWSPKPEPKDARFLAVTDAARAAGRALVEGLAAARKERK